MRCGVPCRAGYHGSGREFVGECSYAVSVYGSPIMSPDQFTGYGYGDGRVTSHPRTMLTCVGAAGGGRRVGIETARWHTCG
jgi:hypothetical protein